MWKKTSLPVLVAFLLIAVVSVILAYFLTGYKKAISGDPNTSTKIKVITTLFPLNDFTRIIGGDKVDVFLLLPPGAEAHAFEPKPTDILRINKADIFVYTSKFMEPWIEELLKSVNNPKPRIINASKGVKLLISKNGPVHQHQDSAIAGNSTHDDSDDTSAGVDPHIWLDFGNDSIMVDNIAAALAEAAPQDKQLFYENAAQYKIEIQKLDKSYLKSLSACKSRNLVHAGHYAFGYLANRYGLNYVSALPYLPDSEPTPQKMAELIRMIKEKDIKYIYYEELIDPKVARALAQETGAKLLMLNAAHNITKEQYANNTSFISLMELNLQNLLKSLKCNP